MTLEMIIGRLAWDSYQGCEHAQTTKSFHIKTVPQDKEFELASEMFILSSISKIQNSWESGDLDPLNSAFRFSFVSDFIVQMVSQIHQEQNGPK
jgi:hypothetical protein